MNIQEGNIRIAQWLGWEFKDGYSDKNVYVKIPKQFQKLNIWEENTFLNFHSNSNWQMLCLKKIMEDNELKSLRRVFSLLEDIQSEINDEAIDISTEIDIFNAIVSYINKQ